MIEAMPIDGHVHLHPGMDPGAWLDAASANFRRYAGTASGGLMLAEMWGVDRFAELADAGQAGPWRIERTDEPQSLRACRDGATLVLIAGRQIVTVEGLEVMAGATVATFAERQMLSRTIDAVADAGAVVVLTYGVGKWNGQRGGLIRAAMQRPDGPRPILGDNGNRLSWTRPPAIFDEARARQIPILPGSDPLPLSGHLDRVGSLGFKVPFSLAEPRPAATLAATLLGLTSQPPVFGRYSGLIGFLRSQAAMQIRKRLR